MAPKTDSGRTVDLPAELVPILEDHLARYVGAEAGALVFTSPEGHPLRRTKFRPRWADACRSVGVSGCVSTTRAARVRRAPRSLAPCFPN